MPSLGARIVESGVLYSRVSVVLRGHQGHQGRIDGVPSGFPYIFIPDVLFFFMRNYDIFLQNAQLTKNSVIKETKT